MSQTNPYIVSLVAFQGLWILALFRREEAVGGPLLVFVVQVFVKTVLSAFAIPAVLIALRQLYRSQPLAFEQRIICEALTTLVPTFIATTVTAIAAIALLKTRNWRYIWYARGGLFALAALAVIDLIRYTSLGNFLEAIFPFVFLPYFARSASSTGTAM